MDNSLNNEDEELEKLDEAQKDLLEKAKAKEKKPMKLHGASLRKIQEIQKKRISRDQKES